MKKVIMFSAPTWCFGHGVISGEREYLSRITRAVNNLGLDYILVDTSGNEYAYMEDLNFKQTGLTHRDYDVTLHIASHFTEMPFFDTYTMATLWNPLMYLTHAEFVHAHLEQSKYTFEAYESHDDFITPSDYQSQAYIDYIGHDKIHLNDFPVLYTSVSQLNIIEPATKFEKIFYVGTGWETHTPGKASRHGYELSNLSKLNLLDIYGPKHAWKQQSESFNYLGDIAQDGKAIFEKINQSGITLALASAEHIRANIATNRVFEGIASGTVIISNLRGVVYDMFGDNILYVDPLLNDNERLQQITAHYQWIQDNPELAREMVINCQNILREKYCLEVLFKQVWDTIPSRQQALKELREIDNHEQVVDVAYICGSDENAVKSDLQQIMQQNYQNLNIIVFTKQFKSLIEQEFTKHKQHNHQLTVVEQFHDHQEFSLFYRYLKNHDTNPYLTFFTTGTLWKHNHISILICLLAEQPERIMAMAKSSLYIHDLNDYYQYNDLYFNDYQKLYADGQRKYVNLSSMLFERQSFFKLINDNSFGSLDYLSGLYLLMRAIYENKLAMGQYITVSSHKKTVEQYLSLMAWEKILMIKYLFPEHVDIRLIPVGQLAQAEQHNHNPSREDNARNAYVAYKQRWQKKNAVGKIASFFKLRKLRNKYKKARKNNKGG